jgi:hypothetical protein
VLSPPRRSSIPLTRPAIVHYRTTAIYPKTLYTLVVTDRNQVLILLYLRLTGIPQNASSVGISQKSRLAIRCGRIGMHGEPCSHLGAKRSWTGCSLKLSVSERFDLCKSEEPTLRALPATLHSAYYPANLFCHDAHWLRSSSAVTSACAEPLACADIAAAGPHANSGFVVVALVVYQAARSVADVAGRRRWNQ